MFALDSKTVLVLFVITLNIYQMCNGYPQTNIVVLTEDKNNALNARRTIESNHPPKETDPEYRLEMSQPELQQTTNSSQQKNIQALSELDLQKSAFQKLADKIKQPANASSAEKDHEHQQQNIQTTPVTDLQKSESQNESTDKSKQLPKATSGKTMRNWDCEEEDSERKDTDEEESGKEDTKNEYFGKENSGTEDSGEKNSEKDDSDKEDSGIEDSAKTNSEKADSQKDETMENDSDEEEYDDRTTSGTRFYHFSVRTNCKCKIGRRCARTQNC